MGNPEPFTATVNYRRLASHLKELGHTKIPPLETVLREVRKMKDAQLVEWVLAKVEQDSEQFHTLLEFQMNSLEGD